MERDAKEHSSLITRICLNSSSSLEGKDNVVVTVAVRSLVSDIAGVVKETENREDNESCEAELKMFLSKMTFKLSLTPVLYSRKRAVVEGIRIAYRFCQRSLRLRKVSKF